MVCIRHKSPRILRPCLDQYSCSPYLSTCHYGQPFFVTYGSHPNDTNVGVISNKPPRESLTDGRTLKRRPTHPSFCCTALGPFRIEQVAFPRRLKGAFQISYKAFASRAIARFRPSGSTSGKQTTFVSTQEIGIGAPSTANSCLGLLRLQVCQTWHAGYRIRMPAP